MKRFDDGSGLSEVLGGFTIGGYIHYEFLFIHNFSLIKLTML